MGYKSEITKLVLQDIASNDDDNLINKILLIPPNIWENDELDNEYWKNKTYHPSLKDKDVRTMETDVVLIGKVIKEKKMQPKKKTKKNFTKECLRRFLCVILISCK